MDDWSGKSQKYKRKYLDLMKELYGDAKKIKPLNFDLDKRTIDNPCVRVSKVKKRNSD